MSGPIIALGLDALSPELLERWVKQGRLPNLSRLFQESAYARQDNFGLYRTENSWLTLLHGCSPEVSHEWGHQTYEAGAYTVREAAAYAFRWYKPFYALGDQRRVAIFDIPLASLVDGVSGVQLLGWGTEVNQILRQSQPPGLMAEMIHRYGRHPLYDTITNADDGTETLSYRIPCVYDVPLMQRIRDQLVASTHQRTAIIRDLMARERWDLLMAAYGEIHTAGHLFWHFSEPHPLSRLREHADGDLLLDVMQAIDHDIGLIAADLPEDAQLFVYSPHGMQPNSLDLYSMLFLPELLYRWSSGKAAFAGQAAGAPVPSARLDYRRHWREEVWDLRTAHGEAVLESPYEQENNGDPLDWDPGNWYRRLWPRMRAFSLPGYSEGLIRVNVAGRDGPGGVAPEDFGRVCDDVVRLVENLVDGRTGEPVTRELIRVRRESGDDPSHRSPADIMVIWRDDLTADTVEHPALGQIGPVPFFRSGGHATQGFVLARSAAFDAGAWLPPIATTDVTATLLDCLGVKIPEHVEGRPFGRVSPAR